MALDSRFALVRISATILRPLKAAHGAKTAASGFEQHREFLPESGFGVKFGRLEARFSRRRLVAVLAELARCRIGAFGEDAMRDVVAALR